MDSIRIKNTSVNPKFLESATEEEAVSLLNFLPKTEVIRAWKLVNGKSVPTKKRKKEGE